MDEQEQHCEVDETTRHAGYQQRQDREVAGELPQGTAKRMLVEEYLLLDLRPEWVDGAHANEPVFLEDQRPQRPAGYR